MMTTSRFIQSKHGAGSFQKSSDTTLIAPREPRPETGHRETRVHAFIAELQGLFVKHVALEPHFGRKRGAHFKLAAAERPGVDQNLQPELSEIEIDPVKLAARERIAQRLERQNLAAKTPVVLVCGARRRRLFQWQPARIHFSGADAGAVRQPAQANMQSLGAETGGPDLG